MKKEVQADELKEFISSLKDQRTALLILDTKLCKHSQRLLQDLNVVQSLASSTANKPVLVHILDMSEHGSHALEALTWLPGVPCLLTDSKVHLGVDAFTKCVEMSRATEGVRVQSLSLPRLAHRGDR